MEKVRRSLTWRAATAATAEESTEVLATLGLEVLAQCPDVATVLVPTGGGGLLAGAGFVALAAWLTYGDSGEDGPALAPVDGSQV